MIGYQGLYEALSRGLSPDPNLWVDEWSDKHMVIPKSSGSREYGNYRTERTPHAREIMRCLSDNHPCRRVIAKVASQMFKTQICINWLGTVIDQSPSNFILSMPTGKLQKRIGLRIDKVIAAVPRLQQKVAKPKSRDATNNQDIKEYIGGSLLIVSSGSSANLAEVPAKYAACDEVDRGSDDHEGSRVKLIEGRQTSFGEDAKSYYYSSPTIDGESEIDELFKNGTQREALAVCVHCHTPQTLVFENLVYEEKHGAMYPCTSCGGVHFEQNKKKMFEDGLWSDAAKESENESFTASGLFLPYGWKSWDSLMHDYKSAQDLLNKGDDSEMVVFHNTKLARTWNRSTQVVSYQSLLDRAEHYQLRLAPRHVLFITAAVDTQDNRLEVQIVGWGRNMSATILDYVVLHGDPANDEVWNLLTDLINSGIEHESGRVLPVIATAIDIGGHRGEAVKHYVRSKRIRCPIAIIGATKLNAQPLSKGSMQDVTWKGIADKKGVMLHSVGTIDIKHMIFSRLTTDAEKDPDKRMIRFTNELTPEYFSGLISETYDRQKKRYVKKHEGIRNEPLDTLTYAFATLYHSSIRAHRYTEKDWKALEARFNNPIKQESKPKEAEPEIKQVVSVAPMPALQRRGKSMMGSLRGRLGR